MIARVRSHDAVHSLSLYFASFHFYLRMIYATSRCCMTTLCRSHTYIQKITATYAYKGIGTNIPARDQIYYKSDDPVERVNKVRQENVIQVDIKLN